MYAFDLQVPTTMEEALGQLSDDDAQALAGGQTLIPTLKARLAAPTRLVSLGAIPELRGLSKTDGQLLVGATTTHATVARDAAAFFPGLAALAGNIGDPSVRNRGTIGGSLANNDPSACYPAAVHATGATIITTQREIAADDFFQGMFVTSLEENELIRAVKFPIPLASRYEKFWQPASRFALTAVFVARFANRVGVAVTGASEEGVFRWREAEKALEVEFFAERVERLDLPEKRMFDDQHGSAEYRAHLSKTLTAQAVRMING